MAKINVQGRRMVQEDKIAKIGEGGGSTYTAGTGIDITEDVISVDTTTIQEKLTAGSGISIDSATNTISATGGSGANFVDFVDMTSRSTVTADEYNSILNGEKRVKYDGELYEVSWIITEPDWSGFTGIRLESSAPGMIKLSTNCVGKLHAVIWAPGTPQEYEFERYQDEYVKANTGDTPGYTLTDIKVGDNVYSVGGSSETVYGSKNLSEDTWDNLVQAGMTVLTSELIDTGTEFVIDGVVGIEYQSNRVILYNATSYANAFTNHNFSQPFKVRKTGNASYKILNGYLNAVTDKTQDYYFEAHGITVNESSQVNYQTNSAGAGCNPLFVITQRDAITLSSRYLGSSVVERKIHDMLDIPRTTAGDYVLSCSTDGSNITEFGWKTPQGGGGTTVSGTNDGTNWTTITIGNDTYGIPSGGSTPSNMVTTNTDQTISADKTFGSNKTINMNDAVKISEYGVFNATGTARSTGFQLGTWDRCKGIVSFNRIGSSTDNPDYPVTSTNDRYNFNIHLNVGGISATANTFIFDPTALYYIKGSSSYGASGANLGTSAHLFNNLYLSGNITDGTNSVNVADLAALIAYAKTQGWIQ